MHKIVTGISILIPLLLAACGDTGSGGGFSVTDAAALYRDRCSECHRLGRYDPEGLIELSRKGTLVARKFAEEHAGVSLSADEAAAMTDFLNSH